MKTQMKKRMARTMQIEISANCKRHLMDHVIYPATKEELWASDNLECLRTEKERKWFKDALPSRTYKDAEDVMHAFMM